MTSCACWRGVEVSWQAQGIVRLRRLVVIGAVPLIGVSKAVVVEGLEIAKLLGKAA